MTVFPFIAKPLLSAGIGLNDGAFIMLMEQRKQLIPQWFLAMLEPKNER
jgi:hypothetical protein